MTSRPSILPTLTAPTGPFQGIPESISAAEAPLMARIFGGVDLSTDSVVATM